MARPLRLEFPGALYHLTAQGNGKAAIFLDDSDRRAFLSILGDVVERHNWICHAYCLMNNHYHLLVETPDGNLSVGMRQLNGVYTQTFNRRRGSVGHAFQGRFKSIVVDKDSYLLALCRYIVLNPVRAGLVGRPQDYPWSSYKSTAGIGKKPDFLFTDWVLAQFGHNRKAAQKKYQSFILAGTDEEAPWKKLTGQCLLGGASFLEKLLPYLNDKTALAEVPRTQRFALRPSLDSLFPEGQTRPERNQAIVQATLRHGYSQKQIAAHMGLHYSTVSRIVQREREKSKT